MEIESYQVNVSAIVFGVSLILLIGGLLFQQYRHQKQWREWMSRDDNEQSIRILTQWLQDMRGSIDQQTSRLHNQLDQ